MTRYPIRAISFGAALLMAASLFPVSCAQAQEEQDPPEVSGEGEVCLDELGEALQGYMMANGMCVLIDGLADQYGDQATDTSDEDTSATIPADDDTTTTDEPAATNDASSPDIEENASSVTKSVIDPE